MLSSARAAAVVHHLAKSKEFAANQVEIRAYADTRPIVDNDSVENRAKNRRVEIIVSPVDKVESFQQVPQDDEVVATAADEQ